MGQRRRSNGGCDSGNGEGGGSEWGGFAGGGNCGCSDGGGDGSGGGGDIGKDGGDGVEAVTATEEADAVKEMTRRVAMREKVERADVVRVEATMSEVLEEVARGRW